MQKLFIFIILSALIGCAGSVKKISEYYAPENFKIPIDANGTHDLKIHYTGCGGLIIKTGETTLMTDPYFSNQGFLKVAAKTIGGGYIKSSSDDITYGLNRAPKNMQSVDAVFVSHAHYDHLLDVPWLMANKVDTKAKVYGSHTMKYILEKSGVYSASIVDVEPNMATNLTPGTWLDIASNVRVLPIRSHHAGHLGKIKLYSGEHKNKFKQKKSGKSKLNHWKEGQTLSYLFEFKDGEETFNLFVQTSSSEKPQGLPQKSVLATNPVDLAVLCVASYKNVQDYPHNHIQTLNPKAIVFVHWEDFFRSYQKSPRTVRGTKVRKFPKEVAEYYNASKFWLPKPGVTMEVKY